MNISVVIPLLDESESLEELHRQLCDVLDSLELESEIIIIDDGSEDDSWQMIEQLRERDARVKGIQFRRNFGKAAALNAGIAHASGEWVITMDADLQDDPNEIPRFLEAVDDNSLDVVSGWKRIRHDPWHKTLPSRVFNWMVSRLTGVRLHDHNCGFKCYRREIFNEVKLYGERHRFVPVLAAAVGWKIGEIEVHHRPRKYGRSKYGVWRMVKGFLDLLTVYFLTGYGQRPQHLLGSFGLFAFLLGGIGIFLLTGWWGISRIDNFLLMFDAAATPKATLEAQADDLHLHDRAIFYYSIVSVLLGAQFMVIGFLAELITSHWAADHEPYLIRKRLE